MPSWQIDDESGDSAARDISALHTPEDQELVEHVRRWRASTSTPWRSAPGPSAATSTQRADFTDGRSARLGDHGADIPDGFEQGYRFLPQHREKLLAADGPAAPLSRQRVRFLFRNTRVYGPAPSAHQSRVHAGRDRSAASRPTTLPGDESARRAAPGPRWWRLVSSEIRSIEDLDIPYFTAQADEEVLRLEDGSTVDGACGAVGRAGGRTLA